jgi:EAL domain-containing protein (putative c-di-GMP-specific phosphodiesterase class I)
VAGQAIDMIAEHKARGHELRLEVNLSARSLGDPKLLAAIEGKLAETGIDPSVLIFEITETAAVASFAQARAFADTLRELGCGFALDDSAPASAPSTTSSTCRSTTSRSTASSSPTACATTPTGS